MENKFRGFFGAGVYIHLSDSDSISFILEFACHGRRHTGFLSTQMVIFAGVKANRIFLFGFCSHILAIPG